MKTYELRFRQFARGRRSIKVARIPANNRAGAALLFNQTVLLEQIFQDPSINELGRTDGTRIYILARQGVQK
jgi:hypothetical protein